MEEKRLHPQTGSGGGSSGSGKCDGQPAPAVVLHLAFPGTASEKERAIEALLERLAELGFTEEPDRFRFRLCLDEAIQNAIEHGNKSDPAKSVEAVLSASTAAVAIRITDQGDGFDPDSLPDPTAGENLLAERGRGIWILKRYMDQVEFADGGRSVILHAARKAASASCDLAGTAGRKDSGGDRCDG